ncbi:hypothetical protein HKX48_009028 [Thoreauomyces humboldtii]|nr:hypothetical protein HKX48_009028 [Thoreauomyces humboldtii]
MKRTFSSKSVFADALSHGSSSHVHLVAPPLPTPPLHTARSSPNLVADLWSSAHPALVPAASAFRIAEALIASGSPSLAIPHLHQAAYGGHSEAQYTIAVFYTQGIPNHLQPNHALAVCYYRLAATQGHAPASCNLGVMFSNGMGGLVKDDVQAFEWFGRSAEGGFAEGMWNLGRAHWAKGELREARRWFAKAADKGCEGARTFVRKLRQREDLDKHYPDVWKASPLRGEDDAGAGRGGLKRTMGPLPQPNTVPRQLMPVM